MMVGLGGVWIEALHDVAMLSPDSDRQDVLRALNGLKGGSILRGWRGEPAADLEAVVDTVVQLGRIIRGNPRIEEIEINPLSRSEEHTSELQSLMRISYAVFCLKKKNTKKNKQNVSQHTTTNH